jgi:hypothetical protein
MKTTIDLTTQAVHDALALLGAADGAGFIRTADPRSYMGADRLRLAEEVAKQLPPGTTAANAGAVAEKLEPVIRALIGR